MKKSARVKGSSQAMLQIMSNLTDGVLGVTASERVSVEELHKRHDKIRLLYHFDQSFSKLEAGSLWEDAKVGLRHLTAWEQVAVVSNRKWIRTATKLSGFAISGETRGFENAQLAEARQWIVS